MAHAPGSRHVEVKRDGYTISTLIHIDASSLHAAIGADADDATVNAWLQRGLSVTSNGEDCTSENDTPFEEREAGEHLVVTRVRWSCPAGTASFTDATLHPAEPHMETWVQIDDTDAVALTGASRTLTLYEAPKKKSLLWDFLQHASLFN